MGRLLFNAGASEPNDPALCNANEWFSFRNGEEESIQRRIARTIAAGFILHEDLGDLRVPDRLAGLVRQQVLFGNVGDVFGFRILGEQMIERLILVRANVLWN